MSEKGCGGSDSAIVQAVPICYEKIGEIAQKVLCLCRLPAMDDWGDIPGEMEDCDLEDWPSILGFLLGMG